MKKGIPGHPSATRQGRRSSQGATVASAENLKFTALPHRLAQVGRMSESLGHIIFPCVLHSYVCVIGNEAKR